MSELTLDELVEKIVREDIYCNVDNLVRYSLEKSYEDSNAPIGYDEVENNQLDFDAMDEDEILVYLIEEYGYTKEEVQEMDDPCEVAKDEYQEPEVYEYWAVSDWLRRKLECHGEVTINSYPNIWGRCTTGQAITLDGVMRRIASDLMSHK